jgi:hypothetical protein
MSVFVNSQNFDVQNMPLLLFVLTSLIKIVQLKLILMEKLFLIFKDTEQENKIFLGKQDLENTICKSLYF